MSMWRSDVAYDGSGRIMAGGCEGVRKFLASDMLKYVQNPRKAMRWQRKDI